MRRRFFAFSIRTSKGLAGATLETPHTRCRRLLAHAEQPRTHFNHKHPADDGRVFVGKAAYFFLGHAGGGDHHSATCSIEVRPTELEFAGLEPPTVVSNVLAHTRLLKHALAGQPRRTGA